ncbi:hypothetical protein ACFQV2_36810 [Actinokineospora soli]|uniref:Uncharacterized protein n=1 Tax=Actinokineospora soli TaxID=1048753 RepID=A0ABW2TZE4_9PSEU
MDENELRRAFARVMDDNPPPMDPDAALERARADLRRRKNLLLGGGAAAAVAVIAAGAFAVAGVTGAGPLEPAAGPRPAPGSTAPDWPDGQDDRTASEGPHHARGLELLDLATAALPAGLGSPDLEWTEERHGPTRAHQAQYADSGAWEYMVTMPVGADGRYGTLLVEVHTPGNADPADPCGLAQDLWGMGGECAVRDVGGKQVGLVLTPTGDDRFEQWAAYRHPDGTTVSIAQARAFDGVAEPGLAQPPLTVDQLLDLVTDNRFALG